MKKKAYAGVIQKVIRLLAERDLGTVMVALVGKMDNAHLSLERREKRYISEKELRAHQAKLESVFSELRTAKVRRMTLSYYRWMSSGGKLIHSIRAEVDLVKRVKR